MFLSWSVCFQVKINHPFICPSTPNTILSPLYLALWATAHYITLTFLLPIAVCSVHNWAQGASSPPRPPGFKHWTQNTEQHCAFQSQVTLRTFIDQSVKWVGLSRMDSRLTGSVVRNVTGSGRCLFFLLNPKTLFNSFF